MKLPPCLQNFANAPLAIFGAGLSGRAAQALARARGLRAVLYDEAPGVAEAHDFDAEVASTHGLVVLSPGFSLSHPWVQRALEAQCTVVGETDFAAAFWPGKLVAVTGTNGKSTLVELLCALARAHGKSAVVAGNIGQPLSGLVTSAHPETVAFCEVSSFQAEHLQWLRPNAVLWTNFAQDHLDRHGSLSGYFRAKQRLLMASAGRRWVGQGVAELARTLGFRLPTDCAVVPPTEAPPMSFAHVGQRQNWALALAYGACEGWCEAVAQEVAEQWQPLPHRFAPVARLGGSVFWNDSKATNVDAALAALDSVPAPRYWIGGGQAKGADLEAFAQALAGRVTRAWLFGACAPKLFRFLSYRVPTTVCEGLQEAVVLAAETARQAPGNIVFAPGGASFDLFKGYADRGESFMRAVLHLPDVRPWHTTNENALNEIQCS